MQVRKTTCTTLGVDLGPAGAAKVKGPAASTPLGPKPTKGSSGWGPWKAGAGSLKGALVGTVQAALLGSLLGACATTTARTHREPTPVVVATSGESCLVDAELRSWIVAGWGRHIRLDVEPGCGQGGFSVEYTDGERFLGRPSIVSFVTETPEARIRDGRAELADTRLEARYRLGPQARECVRRGREYPNRYRLFGPNSSSGLRATLSACQLPLPPHVPGQGGALESFPGVDHAVGTPIE